MITEIFTIEDHVVRDGGGGISKETSGLCLHSFCGLSNTLKVSLLITVIGMVSNRTASSSLVRALSPSAFTQWF